MRIALDFASDWDYRGGIWRHGISLARTLSGIVGPQNVIIPCYDRLPDDAVAELRATGACVSARGLHTNLEPLECAGRATGGRWRRSRAWAARRLVAAGGSMLVRRGLRGADVLHSLFQPRARTSGARVYTIHDLIPLLLPGYSDAVVSRFRQFLERMRDGSLIIVPSEATARDLQTVAGFSAERIRVVHHGVDHDVFHVRRGWDGHQMDAYGVEWGKYFLYVGSFDRRKNLEGLIEAYFCARATHGVTYPLVLAGPAGNSKIPERIRNEFQPHVRYVQYVPEPDLPHLYCGARATILLSHYEGFGFPPLESMACGTPALVANRSSLPEIVGEGAVLVEPDDTQAIARALSRLQFDEDHHRMLRQAGLDRARQFTWRRAGEKTIETYREAISEAASPRALRVPAAGEVASAARDEVSSSSSFQRSVSS